MGEDPSTHLAAMLPTKPSRHPDDLVAALRLLAPSLAKLPQPRQGRTAERWRTFRALGAVDLVLARLAEAHADALAIHADAATAPRPGALYGVWASTSGGTGLTAEPVDGGWRLAGPLRYCSGATLLDRALVTAATRDGVRLFDVPVQRAEVEVEDTAWTNAGMAASATYDVQLQGLAVPSDAAVGGPGWYFSRPGFWVGGIGVAACWTGGVAAVVASMRRALGSREPTPHQLVHLAACQARLFALDAALAEAAAEVDGRPDDDHLPLALTVRHLADQTVDEVLTRSARASGPGPLVRDAEHAQRVADLLVYARQQGAERELERLGRRLLADPR